MVLGWALFYFGDLARLASYLQVMFGMKGKPVFSPGLGGVVLQHLWWLVLAVVLCMPVYGVVRTRLQAFMARVPGLRPSRRG